jgi:hypothetical protein
MHLEEAKKPPTFIKKRKSKTNLWSLQYSFNHAQGYRLFLFLYFSNFFPKVG